MKLRAVALQQDRKKVLGPAKIGPEGSTFMIGGVAIPRDAWERRPEVVARKMPPKASRRRAKVLAEHHPNVGF